MYNKKSYSNADFLERAQESKNRLIQRKLQRKEIVRLPKHQVRYVPNDPYSTENRIIDMQNKTIRKAYRESKLNKTLEAFK